MKKQEQILRRMAEIPRLTRGKLCLLRTSKSGRGFYNLQYWHRGRNNVKYVSDEQYDIYAEAIDGYARFMRLDEEYVDLMTGITEEEAARAKDDE